MRIGYCFLMLATQNDPLGARWIPQVKSAGYQFAEVPLGRLLWLDAASVSDYRSSFEAHDLPVEVFNCAWPSDLSVVGNVDKGLIRAYIKNTMDLASSFGVKVITSCGPVAEMAPSRFDWENTGKKQYVEFLQMMCEAADKHGVTYAIEPINHEEQGYIATASQAIEAIRLSGTNAKLIIDLFHYDREGEAILDLHALYPDWLCHLHFADLAERKVPFAANIPVYVEQLRPLLSEGYAERISIEAHCDNPATDIAAAYSALSDAISSCSCK